MIEEIQVQKDPCQGCCMAPVLLNLYTCLSERWLEKVRGNEGVRMTIQYKLDRKLFIQYTKNASEKRVTECQFADDGAILAYTRPGAEKAVLVYQQTTPDLGLTVSIPKSKHMVETSGGGEPGPHCAGGRGGGSSGGVSIPEILGR